MICDILTRLKGTERLFSDAAPKGCVYSFNMTVKQRLQTIGYETCALLWESEMKVLLASLTNTINPGEISGESALHNACVGCSLI